MLASRLTEGVAGLVAGRASLFGGRFQRLDFTFGEMSPTFAMRDGVAELVLPDRIEEAQQTHLLVGTSEMGFPPRKWSKLYRLGKL